jgi:ribosomal protein S15P/S13E
MAVAVRQKDEKVRRGMRKIGGKERKLLREIIQSGW